MRHVNYCVMCLGKEVKMYQMNSMMTNTYNDLISIPHKVNIIQMYACYECAYLLCKYEKFKKKCRKAYNILSILGSQPLEVTDKCLNSIDRKQNGLVTILTTCTLTYDYQPKNQTCEIKSDENLNDKYIKFDPIPFVNNGTNYADDALQMGKIQLDIKSTPQDNIKEHKHSYLNNKPEDDNEIDYELLDNSTPDQGIENDYQFTHTFQVESNNSKSDAGSMLWLTIQSKENTVCDNTLYSDTTSHLNQECFDTINDYILDKYLVIDGTKTKTKAVNIELKCDTRNCKTKGVLEIGNKIDYKEITDNTSQIKSSDASDIDNNDNLVSLGSKLSTKQVTVTELTPEEAHNEFLLRKESSNYINNPYKCDLCYRGFLTEVSYKSHLKKHSVKYGVFQCDICKLRFPTALNLNQHWIRVHKRKFSCKICPYVCFNQPQSVDHAQSHKGKKYICKKCGMAFGYRNSLCTHMHFKHSVECACEFCGNTFASAKGLSSHKSMIHRGEENEYLGPKCDECDVHFASELAWKRHRVLCSRHEVRYGCKVCGDVFQDSYDLKKHSREHATVDRTQQKYYIKKCFICKETFLNNVALRRHLTSKHPTEITGKLKMSVIKNFVCEFCGKTFLQRSNLVSHQVKHSEEMQYSCPECGMRTKYKDSLTAHLRIHTNECTDKFQCDFCSRPFSDKGRLVRHIRGHMGIRPFKCVACEKTFMSRCDERTHYKHVHDKVPYPKKNDNPKKRRRTKGPHARIEIFGNM